MKYRILAFSSLLVIALLIVGAYMIKGNKEERYHQHLSAQKESKTSRNTNINYKGFCSHLPIVKIDTDGKEIPGRSVHDKKGHRYTTTPDGKDRITAGISIVDHKKKANHTSDKAKLESKIEIHVRGDSSRAFDKVGYKIKLINKNGKRRDKSVMGMDKHCDWVLHGPFLDKTLIRNYMWYNLSGELMGYAPNVRFCEVFINNKYEGLYVMMESITAGKKDGRIQVSVDKKQNSYTGYILKIDGQTKKLDRKVDTFTHYTRRRRTDMTIVYPKRKHLKNGMAQSIEKDFSAFEKMLYSFDFNEKKYGYKKMIDVDSFVNYFIINEFTCNYDVGGKSTYIYKGTDGLMHMCVWDFNNACDAYQEAQVDNRGFVMNDIIWYGMLTKDKDFVNKIIDRYKELRKTVLSEKYLDNYVDETVKYLGSAVDRNFKRWGYSFGSKHDLLIPKERNPRTYKKAVSDLKKFIHIRGNNMDRNIESLKQNYKESRIKRYLVESE